MNFHREGFAQQQRMHNGRRLLKTTVLVLNALVLILGGMAAGAASPPDISPAALGQIQALQDEKAAFTATQQKIDSQLVFALKRHRGQRIARGMVEGMRIGVAAGADGRVQVDIQARVTPDLLQRVEGAGGVVLGAFPRFDAIRASVPLTACEVIAGFSGVRFIRPAVPCIPHTQDREGVAVHEDDRARAVFGADGSGVKVGVLSSGAAYLDLARTNGDLGPVTVLPGQAGSGTTAEGSAMLEIIHAMAPGAQLYFATGEEGEAQFAQNILDLRAAGCDIIVDDILYPDESPFQDGLVAQAVNQVTSEGALYFSAAGNSGNFDHGSSGTWEGDFVDGGPVSGAVTGRGGRIHSFGSNTYDPITKGGMDAVLFWSDPLGASTNDYDLFVLDPTGSKVVASSVNIQNGSQDPLELIWSPTTTGERLVVVKVSGEPRFLYLNSYASFLPFATAGTILGHAAAANAFAVAAVGASAAFPNPFEGGDSDPVESFSSDGPRLMFYASDGTPLTPGNFSSTGGLVRLKPDLAAADGVTTSIPGPPSAPGAFDPFYGTSAAAPHAAAIAALLKSYNPGLTSAQIRTILTSSALPLTGLGYAPMAPGMDRDAGYGIVMAYQALALAPPGPPSTNAPPGNPLPPPPPVSGAAISSLYSFAYNGDGAVPNGLVPGVDGNLYGVTRYGGESVINISGASTGYGTVFRLTTNGALSTLSVFDDLNGASPFDGLVAGVDGVFYGTTRFGGPSIASDPSQFGHGAVVRITPDGAIAVVAAFYGTNGSSPVSGLVPALGGGFYGATAFGGPLTNASSILGDVGGSDDGFGVGYGLVFKLEPDGGLETVAWFTGTNGANPPAAPILGPDGNLYGVTSSGGAFGHGTIFKMTPQGGLASIHDFTGGADGGHPRAGLALGPDGGFYGTTCLGGDFGNGTVFRIQPDGGLTTLGVFDGTNGANPQAALAWGGNGGFYGTAAYGGPVDDGVVFRIQTNGALAALAWFTGSNGVLPLAPLVTGPDGQWYGTTASGGAANEGTVFRFTPFAAPPLIQSVIQSNGMLQLTWSSFQGGIYQPRFTTGLTSAHWSNLGGQLTATGGSLAVTDTIGPDSNRFYQIELLSGQTTKDLSTSARLRRPDNAIAISNSFRRIPATFATPSAPPEPKP